MDIRLGIALLVGSSLLGGCPTPTPMPQPEAGTVDDDGGPTGGEPDGGQIDPDAGQTEPDGGAQTNQARCLEECGEVNALTCTADDFLNCETQCPESWDQTGLDYRDYLDCVYGQYGCSADGTYEFTSNECPIPGDTGPFDAGFDDAGVGTNRQRCFDRCSEVNGLVCTADDFLDCEIQCPESWDQAGLNYIDYIDCVYAQYSCSDAGTYAFTSMECQLPSG